jgi:plasmid stabilization system protein ParE
MKYDVYVAFKAKREIAAIQSWMKRQSVVAANRWLDRIDRAIESLASDPL